MIGLLVLIAAICDIGAIQFQQELRDQPSWLGATGSSDHKLQDFQLDVSDNLTKECLQQFDHLPALVLEQLDEPGLMCLPRKQLKPKVKALARTHAKIVLATDSEQHDSIDEARYFPREHVEVGTDPVLKRDHIVVVGPESSGTNFVHSCVGAVFNRERPPEFMIIKDVILMHFSQPEGMMCEKTENVPILDDFGPKPGNFHVGNPNAFGFTLDEVAMPSYRGRYMLDVPSLLDHYTARRESIRVVQVVRDPEISRLSKIARHHCENQTRAFAEQSQAFKLMLDSMNKPHVTTVCYEEMLDKGSKYVKEKIAQMGLKTHHLVIPEIRSANQKWHTGTRACDYDAMAYMKLCPESPHTKLLADSGCLPNRLG